MAHFYGSIKGGRGQATRLGTKNSGMTAVVASWEGAVVIDAYHDPKTGKDMVSIAKTPWQGAGEAKEVYSGKIGKVI
jgi:hypothetical protein